MSGPLIFSGCDGDVARGRQPVLRRRMSLGALHLTPLRGLSGRLQEQRLRAGLSNVSFFLGAISLM